MAYAAGDVLPADDLNRMGVSLRRAANQTLSDVTLTSISWDTQDEDTDNLWSSGTTVTIPEAGLWAITAKAIPAATSAGIAYIELSVTSSITASNGIYRQFWQQNCSVCAVIRLAASDTFIVRMFGDTAAGTTFTASLECYRLVGGA